ncbi:MAG TPA: class I SAM-dependent methyltransferase, partial [Chitinophagaceae bacterium]|nr:class I SAM-dependent methyltransferase [Chitinophagaceae bacterium]
MQNINDTYFDGYYKEIWRVIIPDELTVKEVDFIMQYFNLKPGSKVLDMMCGFGRHAIGLARKGIVVTAVDNLSDYISEIKEIAEQDNLPLLSVQSDIINYASDDSFDLAICMGNSLNFFNAEDSEKIMSNICRQLRPGGKFLINTWSLTEIIAKSFKEREWSRAGQLKFLTECKYLF